jgi:hypothetical protein
VAGKSNFEMNEFPNRQVRIQGDQIRRIFAHGSLSTLGSFFQSYIWNPYLGPLFSTVKFYALSLTKTGWATLWAIFHELVYGHPVGIPQTEKKVFKYSTLLRIFKNSDQKNGEKSFGPFSPAFEKKVKKKNWISRRRG